MATLLAARLKACKLWPYGAHSILSLIPVESDKVPTMGVDQYWRLYYNPTFLANMPIQEAAGVILHEVYHLLMRHHKRAKFIVDTTDPFAALQWNIAADLAINHLLKEEGVALPANGAFVENTPYDPGLTAEAYYLQIRKDATPVTLVPQPGGSCSDGIPRPWEMDNPDECDTPGMGDAEAEAAIHKVAEKVSKGTPGSHRGGGMMDWAKKILSPQIDPRRQLLGLVRQAVDHVTGIGAFTYQRPNRRSSADSPLPANVAPVPRITVIVDTSGSMGNVDLGLAVGVIGKVLKSLNNRDGIRVLCADTQVESVAKIFNPKSLQLHGGGGTRMDLAIEAAAAEKPKPQLIIVATDGETRWPDPVGVPVVACITTEKGSYTSSGYSAPSWIKTIYVHP